MADQIMTSAALLALAIVDDTTGPVELEMTAIKQGVFQHLSAPLNSRLGAAVGQTQSLADFLLLHTFEFVQLNCLSVTFG
jgi:hypothetical protein